jgi:hypothetical protein
MAQVSGAEMKIAWILDIKNPQERGVIEIDAPLLIKWF